MAWFFLILAGLCEILGVINMKKYMDTKKKLFLAAVIITFSINFIFLAMAMKTIPMSTAYAIWTGIGTAGSAIVGFLIFKEKITALNLLFIGMVAFGAIGLKLLT